MRKNPYRPMHETGYAIAPHRQLLSGPALLLSVCLTAAISASAADPEIADTGEAGAVSIEFHDGRLSLEADQVPVVELMQLVGEEAGFEVAAYGDFARQRISLSFTDIRLANAVKRLLQETSAIISYRPAAEPGAERSIAKIYLLGSGPAAEGAEPIRLQALEADLDNDLRASEIESTDTESRIAAIDRAEGLGDELTQENLAFSLQHDPDPAVRLKAITAIGEIGGSTAADMLEAGLGDDNARVRQQLVQTLGAIDDERIPFWLGQVLMGDPSPEVRLAAVQSLARQGGDTARVFIEAATGDSSSDVSEAALGLLR